MMGMWMRRCVLRSPPFLPILFTYQPPLCVSLTFTLKCSQLKTALEAVESIYTQRITHYRRLLERAQFSSAQQLLALQAALDSEREKVRAGEVREREREKEVREGGRVSSDVDFFDMIWVFGIS